MTLLLLIILFGLSAVFAPRFIPVDAPWALLLMLLAMLGLGWMQRERMR